MAKTTPQKAFFSALQIYGFLVVELLSLRLLFHSLLKVKIGWSFTTDFGLFVPLSFAFFIFWMALAKNGQPNLTFEHKTARLHLALVGALVLFTSCFQGTEGIINPSERAIWFLLLAGVILSGLILFVPPRFYFKNENTWTLIPCALIGISVPLYQHHYEVLWPLLGNWTGKNVCGLLPAFGMEGAFCKLNQNSQLIISAVPYRAILAPGCVGLEGQLFNVLTVLVYWMVSTSNFKPFKLFSYFIIGSLGVYWINIFRILSLIKLGHWSMLSANSANAQFWVSFVFHSHAGWILYGAYLGALYRFLPSFESKIAVFFDKRFSSQSDAVSF